MNTNCYICSGKIRKINEFSFKCKDCDYYFSNLKPGVGQDVSGLKFLRKKNFRKIIDVFLKFIKKPKILEIGSGDGYFLEECINYKLSIIGSEASQKSVKKLRSKFNNQIIKLRLPENIKKKYNNLFDVIIFNDVFEHLTKLNEVIKCISRVLAKDGVVVINLPSSDGINFKLSKLLMSIGISEIYNRLWQKDFSSPHLSYFNKNNLTNFLLKHNFKMISDGYLDTVDFNNKERFDSLFKNYLFKFLLKIFLIIFFYIQRILPKDNIFLIFKKN